MKTKFKNLMLPIILVAFTTVLEAQSNTVQSTGSWKLAGNTLVGGEKLGSKNAFNVNMISNNITRLTLTSGGNIGMGTTTPVTNYGVHMLGGIGDPLPAGLYIQRADANPSNQDCALGIGFSSNLFTGVGIGGGSCGFVLTPSVNTPSPDMAFSTNHVNPQFIIKYSGKVGVGTANPLEKLHIDNGAIRITGNNGNGGPMILFGGSSTAGSAEWGIEYTNNLTAHNGLNFWKPFGSSNGGNNFLFLNDNGNIGVGTDNPTAQFTVTGNVLIGDATTQLPAGYKLYVETGILTEKVKVAVKNSTNWADYVFDPNYKLMSLTEIKQYVKTNKHLPNIPSADSLKNEGLDLGTMAAKQMEKIEELTLHLIQINERLEILEKENAALKTAVITSPVK